MIKIKVCGITNKEDYIAITNLGIDYTGFIFYPPSPRYIEPIQAKEIYNTNNPKNLRVGVFVNETLEKIIEIVKIANLNIVQLHGDETSEFSHNLTKNNISYWKVIRPQSEKDIEKLEQYDTDIFLLDTYTKKSYGGTGKQIDYNLLQKFIDKANQLNKRIIVAGGIGIDNIEDILKLSPYGVDLNSKVEIEPGKKDINKLKNILQKIKDYYGKLH